MDQFLERLIPPCLFFLFSIFLAEFPSGAWVLTKPANFAWASPSGEWKDTCGLRRWYKFLVLQFYWSFPLCIYPEVGFLDRLIVLILIF